MQGPSCFPGSEAAFDDTIRSKGESLMCNVQDLANNENNASTFSHRMYMSMVSIATAATSSGLDSLERAMNERGLVLDPS